MSSASYPVINGVNCVPEIQVKFKTYNQLDHQTYYGTIAGCVNYTIAANLGTDIDALHGNMTASVAKQNLTSQTFLIIVTTDGSKRPFATIWIDEDTFVQTDAATDRTVVLHNISDAEFAKILTSIRDMGFDVTEKTT